MKQKNMILLTAIMLISLLWKGNVIFAETYNNMENERILVDSEVVKEYEVLKSIGLKTNGITQNSEEVETDFSKFE